MSSNSRRSLGSLRSARLPPVCLMYNFHIVADGTYGMHCSTTWLSSLSALFKVSGRSSAATKALCLRFLLCTQRVLYLSWLTHDWDTNIENTFATTMLHNIEHHPTEDVRASSSTYSSKPINSSSVFSIWLLLSFMFTTGSSTILTAVGDHLFAIGPFPLATRFWNPPLRRLFKGGKVNKEAEVTSQSNNVTWLPLLHQWLTSVTRAVQIGFDSERGRSVHLQRFAFYKPIKSWSHRDGSSSNWVFIWPCF